MNISGLIKNMLGDLQISDPKTLELKVGQIVKGVVLQLLSEQDAIVNIGGVQVRARLETPLKQGDVTMLQVQPESASGQVMLKPLQSSGVQIADDSLAQLVKEFGMKDNPEARQTLQLLHQSGVPLTKDTAQQFVQVQSQRPDQAPKEEWSQAAVVAAQKGLPLTKDTVQAVRQSLFGQPLHDTLNRLSDQVGELLKGDGGLPAETKEQLQKLQLQLNAVRAAALPLAEGGSTGQKPDAAQASGDPQALASPAQTSGKQPQEAAKPTVSPSNPQIGGQPQQASVQGQLPPQDPKAMPAAQPAAASSAQQAAETAARGSMQESAAAKPPLSESAPPPRQSGAAAAEHQTRPARPDTPAGQESANAGGGKTNADNAERAAQSPVKNDTNTSDFTQRTAARGTDSAADGNGEHAVFRLLKAMGLDHERQINGLPARSAAETRTQQAESGSLSAQTASANDGVPDPFKTVETPRNAADALRSAETLKGMLLQLANSDDVPPALKETAQQAVQQITGQQLMLTGDRAGVFTSMTMFLPLLGPGGQQTAAIHIQSRKGPRGELDAGNCRLVFDLKMKEMGDTLVDVQVVDRIVSLNVHNNHPIVAQLLESHREEIAAGMARIGYQFISLKCSQYPERLSELDGKGGKSGGDGGRGAVNEQLRALYSPKTYKGVDIKV
ncbi:hypothetical protein [Paenibacillus thalictri]|uniref:Flagellar hook-length control protein FliK n=1 Tax=Paenibacillus thalictri TaxID=2527873 RepID=A0A4Q9DRC8_9BACL|nr:hypothetical protein [Paenibacillus thalictri]TBL77707.1 hypothetical protein EYB31_16320 [Paenibacillus thalictri]